MTQELTTKQKGWITLSAIKQTTEDQLQAMELRLQTVTDLKELSAGINEMVEYRKGFTSRIEEKLIKPMMEYEKRAKIRLEELKAADLAERQRKKAEEQERQALEDEKASYRALLVSYYAQKEKNYVQALYNCVEHYHAKGDKETCIKELELVKPKADKPTFKGSRLDEAMKREIASQVQVPDFNLHLNNVKADAERIFEIPKMDIATVKVEAEQKIEAKAALEHLNIKTEIPEIVQTKIKVLSKVQVSDKEDAKAVIIAFLQIYPFWESYLRVRTWESLCDKMAAAVAKHHDETGEVFDNVKYERVEK